MDTIIKVIIITTEATTTLVPEAHLLVVLPGDMGMVRDTGMDRDMDSKTFLPSISNHVLVSLMDSATAT